MLGSCYDMDIKNPTPRWQSRPLAQADLVPLFPIYRIPLGDTHAG